MLTTGCCGLRRGLLVSEHHPLASLASALQWAEAEQVLPERYAGVKRRLSYLLSVIRISMEDAYGVLFRFWCLQKKLFFFLKLKLWNI